MKCWQKNDSFAKIELDLEVFTLLGDFNSKLESSHIFKQEDFDFIMVERLEEKLEAFKASKSGRTSLLWIDLVFDFACNVYCKLKADEEYPVDKDSRETQRTFNSIYRTGCMTGCTRALYE